jgi:NADH:ubiquinone oxidoreductase subunit 6 (subunit J)
MAEVLFFIAAIGAVAGAVGTVALRNPFYAVLSLVCHLLALAALFLLLRAEFVAAAQVVVYAGAVMVLYVFVVAYVGGGEEPLTASTGASLRFASILFALVLFVELTIALVGTGLSALDTEGAGYQEGFGTPAQVGELFLTKFLVAFEIASLLLLIAAVGAVILARRRAGLGDTGEVSVADVMRRPEVTAGQATPGSMIEAAGPPQR